MFVVKRRFKWRNCKSFVVFGVPNYGFCRQARASKDGGRTPRLAPPYPGEAGAAPRLSGTLDEPDVSVPEDNAVG